MPSRGKWRRTSANAVNENDKVGGHGKLEGLCDANEPTGAALVSFSRKVRDLVTSVDVIGCSADFEMSKGAHMFVV